MLMANLQATLRGQTLFSTSCKDCLQRSNKLLFQSTDLQKFATLFYGILNTRKNELCYSNAGHDYPFLFSGDKEPRRLETGGTILGFMEDFAFKEQVVPFNSGDLLLVYSDGITEAMNADEEEFGENRLVEVTLKHRDELASTLIEKIIAAVKLHTGDAPQMDDITLVVIKRETL